MTGDSAYPKILGVYSQHIASEIGSGTTRVEHQNVTYWYVLQIADGLFEIQPLTAQGLPSGIKKKVAFKSFITSYIPEPFYYTEHPVDVMERLSQKLLDMDEDLSLGALDDQELTALRAIMVDPLVVADHAPKDGDQAHQVVLDLARKVVSALMSRCPICRDEHRVRFNSFGVTLRKEGHHDQSLGFFSKALAIEKNDENIYFNIARTCFDMGDYDKCRQALEKALSINPAFIEAAKFLQYLAKMEPSAG
jgi:hypothetical protein